MKNQRGKRGVGERVDWTQALEEMVRGAQKSWNGKSAELLEKMKEKREEGRSVEI